MTQSSKRTRGTAKAQGHEYVKIGGKRSKRHSGTTSPGFCQLPMDKHKLYTAKFGLVYALRICSYRTVIVYAAP